MKINMKSFIFSLIGAGFLLGFISCSDWTSTTKEDIENHVIGDLYSKRDSAKWAAEDERQKENAAAYQKYIENLQAYKKTKHPIMFGWFNAWQPDGAGKYGKLSQIPDSMDVISIWGSWGALSAEKIKELHEVQSKGTKVIIGWIVTSIGDQIRWGRNTWPANDSVAIVEYAKAICDTINKYGYDGFDLDYEPSYAAEGGGTYCGSIVSCYQNSGKEKEILFMKTMRQLLGPNKLMHINGSIHWLDKTAAQYFDRFVVQSYNYSNSGGYKSVEGSYQNWIRNIMERLNIRQDQIVFTESFQGGGAERRANFPRTYSGYVNYLKGNLGGVGVFHINEDAFEDDSYRNIRAAINMMNPSVR